MKIKIAALQLCSVLDYKENLAKIRTLLADAKKQGATHAFLPEVFYSMSDGTAPGPYLIEGDSKGPHFDNIRNLAKDSGLFVLAGSAATKVNDKIMNRAYNFAPDGTDLGTYDKRNLFSCEIEKDGQVKKIDEGIIYSRGSQGKMIEAGALKVGLSICFDLRFPAIYQDYVRQGANIMTVSSAFTVPTGKAHWHILVRARAIESQCYVIAPAQWGRHNERIQTYGHSLIVSPWGDILADAGEGEKAMVAEMDLREISLVRKSVKVFC